MKQDLIQQETLSLSTVLWEQQPTVPHHSIHGPEMEGVFLHMSGLIMVSACSGKW